MLVKFWSKYSKKKNSLAVPLQPAVAEIEVHCTEPVDALSPALWVGGYQQDWNYCYIEKYHRYYFVVSPVFAGARSYITLVEDVLASWRDAIRAHTALVTRSESRFDSHLIDSEVISKYDVKTIQFIGDYPFTVSKGPRWIVQYIGDKGIETVLLTKPNFDNLCEVLWRSWREVPDMTDILATIFDPFQYIISVHQTYLAEDFWTGSPIEEMHLGVLNVFSQGWKLSGRGQKEYTLKLPKHPQAGFYPYLNGSPYSALSVYLPGVGWVELPADAVADASSIIIHYDADCYSGECMVDVSTTGGVIASFVGRVAVPWMLPGSSVNAGGAATGVAGAVSAGLRGGKAGAVGIVAGIASAFDSMQPTVSTKGSTSGTASFNQPFKSVLKYQDVVMLPVQTYGKPLMQRMRLADITGYMQCDRPEFSAAQYMAENDRINDFLQRGCYNE